MSDLIRREDVFKAIVGLTTHKTVDDIEIFCEDSVAGSEGWLGGIRDALRAIEDVPSAEPERKWIPISEALPEDEDEVIVTVCDKSGYTPDYYSAIGIYSTHLNCWIVDMISDNVIAWMPLPEPWRGE